MQPRSFLESLFDFSFTAFISTKIVKVLYAISVAGAGLVSLLLLLQALSATRGLTTLVMVAFAVLFFLITVCYARLFLELIIVLFRIAEHIAELAAQGRERRRLE